MNNQALPYPDQEFDTLILATGNTRLFLEQIFGLYSDMAEVFLNKIDKLITSFHTYIYYIN